MTKNGSLGDKRGLHPTMLVHVISFLSSSVCYMYGSPNLYKTISPSSLGSSVYNDNLLLVVYSNSKNIDHLTIYGICNSKVTSYMY